MEALAGFEDIYVVQHPAEAYIVTFVTSIEVV